MPVEAVTIPFRCGAEQIAWLPSCNPEPPDLNGFTFHHKMLATGYWFDDLQAHLLSVVDVQLTCKGRKIKSVQSKRLVDFIFPGALTDLKVADIGDGEVLILAGNSGGAIIACRLRIPRAPGTKAGDLQALDVRLDEDQCLLPWATPHAHAVSAVDYNAESARVLSAGADGALSVLTWGDENAGMNPPYKAPSPTCSYTTARWAGSQTFITASSTTGLEVWDIRQRPIPVAQQDTAARVLGREIHSLATHPSRPNLIGGGSRTGVVALWDVRHTSTPMSASRPATNDDGGPVWKVMFDTYSSTSATAVSNEMSAALVFCRDDGTLGRASQGPGGVMNTEVLYSSPSPLNVFDIEGGTSGVGIVTVDDAQELTYLAWS